MLALPCDAVIDAEMSLIDGMSFTGRITFVEACTRRAALLDILSDAGLIPDEPKETR
jgi:hypothetical protein